MQFNICVEVIFHLKPLLRSVIMKCVENEICFLFVFSLCNTQIDRAGLVRISTAL